MTPEILCQGLPPPSNGHVLLSNETLDVGTTATYSCDPGYVLAGGTTRTCDDRNRGTTGTWSGSVPMCEGIHIDQRSYEGQSYCPFFFRNHQMPTTDPAQQWSSHHFLWHTWSHPG